MEKQRLTPYKYQIEGARWLAEKKLALLADAPRLGKAVQGVLAADILNANLVLVVCRGVARTNWAEEFKRWSSDEWRTIIVKGKMQPYRPSALPTVIVTSYESLPKALESLKGIRFDVSIIDESHYLKSPTAKRSKLCLGKLGLPASSSRLWLMTGTPTPNGIATELWTTLFAFGLTKKGYLSFAKEFCEVKDGSFGTEIKPGNEEQGKLLADLMRPKVLRRTFDSVGMQLPKMQFSTVVVEGGSVPLEATSLKEYVGREDELKSILELEYGLLDGLLDTDVSEGLVSLLQANAKSISTIRKYDALQKVVPACEIIAGELENNEYRKTVIFAHHRDVIQLAAKQLAAFKPVIVNGTVTPDQAQKNIDWFKNDPHCRVFIGNIGSSGTSINLSVAHHINFLERTFVPEDNNQAQMRCSGVTQDKPVFIRDFNLKNSYDSRLTYILRDKIKGSDNIFKNEME